MIDRARRKTLKALTLTAGAGAALATGTAGLASAAGVSVNSAASQWPELASIDVVSRVSVLNNDLEIALTNTGSQTVRISQMTPSVTVVPRGEFDFARLLKKGPLTLQPGESVVVPLQHRRPATPAAAYRGESLAAALRKSVSIVTDDDAFASVTVRTEAMFA